MSHCEDRPNNLTRTFTEKQMADRVGGPDEETRRADDAGEEDDIGRDSQSEKNRQAAGIKRSRKGKWTVEEEDFANKLIQFFQ